MYPLIPAFVVFNFYFKEDYHPDQLFGEEDLTCPEKNKFRGWVRDITKEFKVVDFADGPIPPLQIIATENDPRDLVDQGFDINQLKNELTFKRSIFGDNMVTFFMFLFTFLPRYPDWIDTSLSFRASNLSSQMF